MGLCQSAAPPTGATITTNAKASFTKIINGKCSHIRLDHNQPKLFQVKGNRYDYTLNYVFCAQRGFYPTGEDMQVY